MTPQISNYPAEKSFPKNMSPYPFKETIGWLWRNLRLKTGNPGCVQYIPQEHIINDIEPGYKTEVKIGFFGDYMDTFGKQVQFSENIKKFFSDCNYIIGNLEGTIYEGKKEYIMDQTLPESTIKSISFLKNPSDIFLSLSNNHAGDCSQEIYENSRNKLKSAGFHIFGEINCPYIDINNNIRIFSLTEWSNKLRGFDRIAGFHNLDHIIDHILYESPRENLFNILYPHWGYELELYPRISTINKAKKYLDYFDCIIGHHAHVPQPITILKNKPVAFSLGDICFRNTSRILKRYCFGEILKITIGFKDDGWKIGNINWKFVESTFPEDDSVFVDIIDYWSFKNKD